MSRRFIGFTLAALTVFPLGASAARYEVDPSHTSVVFKIRHIFTNVAGRFTDFEGTIDFDPENFAAATVAGSIQAASIDTDNEKRDKHLRSNDFFDVEKYPTITFESTEVTDVDPENKTAKLHGNLTMHGVAKPIVLDVSYLGTAKDPWGNTRGGFTATGIINRKDFGINWNETLDSGGLLIGEEVEIEIDVEGTVAKQ